MESLIYLYLYVNISLIILTWHKNYLLPVYFKICEKKKKICEMLHSLLPIYI